MLEMLTMNPPDAQSEPTAVPIGDPPNDGPRKPTRFTYASGTRPLDGYTIKRGVGSGGFGEVYFAVSDAGKEVALKLIRRNLEVELRGVKQCLNLKHPNLVSLFDIRTDDLDDQWVVMEYVSGASLEDMIERHPAGMPKDMALEWFEGIASAVAYLHDHGIVHRDLKPANIFIDEGGVKIGDYGLSKFISCSRRSGQTESVGTVHYMAPEIANGRYGREIDTYALGIIFYEMLTGHVPFEGESVGEVLMKHLTAEPDFSVIEQPYRKIIEGAMAKDPDVRIKSVADMLAILRANGTLEDGPLKSAAAATAFTAATAATSSPAAGMGAAASVRGDEYNQTTSPESTAPRPEIKIPKYEASHSVASNGTAFEGTQWPEEPIAAWFWQRVDHIRYALQIDQWQPYQRYGAAGLLIALATVSGLWLVAAIPVCLYGFYWIFWSLVNAPSRSTADQSVADELAAEPVLTPLNNPVDLSPSAPQNEKPTPQLSPKKSKVYTQSPWRKRKNPSWRQAAYRELADRTIKERASSLLGTLLLSAVVASATAIVASMFVAQSNASPELSIWMALTATMTSWAVIAPAKIAEGRFEDQAPMRFIMLLSGAAVGLVAWGLSQILMVDLPVAREFVPGPNDTLFGELFRWRGGGVSDGYLNGAVSLPLTMYASYFTMLLVGLRWWRQADYTRSSRVSLWTIAVCGAASWGLSLITWFPQPVGMIVVMTVAFAVQLTSHWLPPSRRRELAGEVV
ncbi:serine/threonine-protein kinase [Adhaeretor mobilis]|uniref:non-specific serine/threonine protein kinase n=1 Tax=Adhaeretor mobilis TaxID=1930276 RepID=A0A517MS94_9BACT|nr:serine/threonine-protein kinase [Adhaeretor mobilis]QDS97751.1 Serine/threonine-protein kinase PrkC [Adhaeretor mobilis]